MKQCSTCQSEKLLEEFSRSKYSKDGFFGICKDCDHRRRKRYNKRLKPVAVDISETQAAYLAGLLDGEGYIGITQGVRKSGKYAGQKSYHSRLVIGITTGVIFDIKNEYGVGKIYKSKARKKRHKDRYDWTISSNEIRGILPKIMPFLKIKKRQAELLLEYLRLAYTDRDRTGVYRAKVDEIYAELRKLNKRGKTK